MLLLFLSSFVERIKTLNIYKDPLGSGLILIAYFICPEINKFINIYQFGSSGFASDLYSNLARDTDYNDLRYW
jgi:hypothetical protein